MKKEKLEFISATKGSLLHGNNKKETQRERQKNLFTMTSGGFVIVVKFIYSEKATKFCEIFPLLLTVCTGKSLSEALLFAEHGEKLLCTKLF